jgi:hypothetical protein
LLYCPVARPGVDAGVFPARSAAGAAGEDALGVETAEWNAELGLLPDEGVLPFGGRLVARKLAHPAILGTGAAGRFR